MTDNGATFLKKKHQLNNEEKSNATVLDYFKYLHYGKRNKHKNFVLEKMNIGHFYQIKDLFRYISPKPLVSNRHYDIWIMKWCFLFENVGVIYPKA